MRYLILALLLSCVNQLQATNYYFSSVSGDDSRTVVQAQNPATPWKSIAKLNAMLAGFSAGDSILFKRGEVFVGGIVVSRSGTQTQPIVFAAYGQGAKPVITGLTEVNNWVSRGANIWEANPGIGTRLNILAVNGEAKALGRFPNYTAPNKGYLNFEATSGNNQITDNELSGTPDFTGGEVVIRKNRWVLDKNYITRHAGNTIYYTTGSPNWPSSRHGYFVQNHPKTLDQHGEWYYNVADKRLGIYFTGDPNAANVQISTVNTLVSIYNRSDLVFTGLRFSGANQSAFEVHQSQRVSIIDCEIVQSGVDAVTARGTSYLVIERNLVEETNNVGINAEYTGNTTIRGNTIRRTGMVPGMGKEDSGSYEAIMLTGDNHLIEGNQIENTGYIPITFRGNTNIIRNNFVNGFSIVKDDGSGIYSWNNVGGAPPTFGSKIINNIIINGIGAGEGTNSPNYLAANGIYMDDGTANVEITGNTVANMPLHGLYIHNAHGIAITNNTFFNAGSQIALIRDQIAPQHPVRNLNVQHNIFLSKTATQPTAEFWSYTDDISLFGTFDNNYYARPVNDLFTIKATYVVNGVYQNKTLNLDQWKALYGKDLSSKKSPVSVSSPDLIRFEYNASSTARTIALDKAYVDVKNNTYTTSVRLEPFTSIILLPKTISTPVPGACPSTGGILREQWDNVAGNDVALIPVNAKPSSSIELNIFETVSVGDNFGARIRGYVCPPVTGDYTFFLSADDAAELWLSTTDQPANKRKIASILSYTEYNEWNKFPGQTSVKIRLNAGQRYYVEALHKEGGGGDHISVGWQLPNGTKEMPMPGHRLIPFGVTGQQPDPEPEPNPNPEPEAACTSKGTLLRELWLNVAGTAITDIPVTIKANTIAEWNSFQTSEVGENFAERLRGYVCVPYTGNYTFFISGDDAVELWLSTDELVGNRKKIASVPGYTLVNEWNKYPSQTAAPVYLQAGRKYYVEVLHKEGGGGDHFTVGWQLPDGRKEIPIAARRLSPFSAPPVPEQPQVLCSATGSILREQWDNVTGNNVINIPLSVNPTSSSQLTSFQSKDLGDNYGARIRGFICPPQTGKYTFQLSGDDAAELWLSTDESPANKRKIASLLSYTLLNDYNKFASQSSIQIELQTGRKYYIEVLHKEGGGGDHVSVAWTLPSGVREAPIPGNRLSPAAGTTIPPVTPVPPATQCVSTGSVLMEQWLNVSGATVAEIPVSRAADKITSITRLQTYNMGDRYGVRLRGYICAPLDGAYTFSVAGDDAVELWLSTDADPARKRRIVSLASYTGFQDWFKSPSQTSAPITLKAGTRYYFEVLHKEANGGDHLSIGWVMPDKRSEFPLAENRLSPYVLPATITASNANKNATGLEEMQLVAQPELKAYPSPFTSSATIRVNAVETGNVKLEVYDLHGKMVKSIYSGWLEGGSTRTFRLEGNGLSKGVYIIRLSGKSGMINQKISYNQ